MANEQHNDPDERVAKMDADQFYTNKGGKFLKGADIAGLEWEVTIKEAFKDKDFNGHDAIAITFHEIEQQLTLNKGNYLMVKENTGSSDTDTWINKKIVLFGTRDLNPKGEMVDVVRIRPPERQVKRVVPGKSKSPSLSENPGAGLDDEIPF
jgi:hypothetical protein